MSSKPQGQVGSIMWMDLTIPNATEVRDFGLLSVGGRLDECLPPSARWARIACAWCKTCGRGHGAVREEMTARRRAASGIR